LLAVTCAVAATAANTFDIRERGAKGDGQTLDTAAIQAALDAGRDAGGGQVRFPPGRYLSGTIHFRSGVAPHLDAGARLIGTTNLAHYAQPTPPAFVPEAKWGKRHRGLFTGENVQDVAITGPGTMDGNKVFDPKGEERMRGAYTIAFVNCRRFTLRDVTIVDAANYAVFFQMSDDVEIRNVKFVGGWDGVHWRGAPERWCQNVSIIGCQFFTRDDAIAGRYWNNTVIKDCLINSSCNGIRLFGPATRLTIANNLFRSPGEQSHRASGEQRRTNMRSGIILQPGAWDATRGPLDDVLIANNVKTTRRLARDALGQAQQHRGTRHHQRPRCHRRLSLRVLRRELGRRAHHQRRPARRARGIHRRWQGLGRRANGKRPRRGCAPAALLGPLRAQCPNTHSGGRATQSGGRRFAPRDSRRPRRAIDAR